MTETCKVCDGDMVRFGDSTKACESAYMEDGRVVVGDHDFSVVPSDCLHGMVPSDCAICLGRWDHDVRSGVTGKVRSSREYIPWFVPTSRDQGEPLHPCHVRDRKTPSDNGSPSSSIPEAPLPSSATPSVGLEVVGRPRWYREQVLGEESISDRCIKAGLDWYGFAELHAAEVLLQVTSDDREVWPTVVVEPGPAYPGMRRTGWTAWRASRTTTPQGV